MDASPRFWNRIAARYAARPVADEAAYRRKLDATRARLHPDMQLLEIGCGTGTTALAHAPHVAGITAIDFSEEMIAIARDRAEAAAVGNVRFEIARAGSFDAPAQSFDGALALSLLHLVEDRAALLALLHGWLKPGGLLVTSTMCLADGYGWLRPVAAAGRALNLLPLVRFFTAEELADSIRTAGFRIEENWRPSDRGAVFIIARKAA